MAGLVIQPAKSAPAIRSLKSLREEGVIMQKWENSCAAAAIATVLTFAFGHPVSERFAASSMLEKTNPDKIRNQGGFSLLDLKTFVEGRGFEGAAYKNLSVEDLALFKAPIVPIRISGYNHYVVINSIRNNRVYLADPSFGNLVQSVDNFEKSWIDGLAFVVTERNTQ